MVGVSGEPTISTEGAQAVEVLAEASPNRQRPSDLGAYLPTYWFGVLLVQVPSAISRCFE